MLNLSFCYFKKSIFIISGIQFLNIFILIFACAYSNLNFQSKKQYSGLAVSDDGHFLLKGGNPFFWMGDTGWVLFTQSPEDIKIYFQNRVNHQFTVIQMMVTRRMFDETSFTPNYQGEQPFESLDPVALNEAYFSHIDAIVGIAEKNNLILAMAPTWGGVLDHIFSVNDPSKAYDFGYLLGKRYQGHKNVVWIVCGEYHKIAWDTEVRKPNNKPDLSELNLIDNLAHGLEAGHQGKNLMTIHPDGWQSSSVDFHHAEWLDFNMVQSYSIGTGTEFDIINDYNKIPPKPTILAEPGYEFGGAGHKAFEIRYEGYHSVLNGAFGYTYGCQGVWDFNKTWKSLLNSEGALQMKYMRKLFESRPMLHRVPAPEMIKGGQGNWVKLTKIAAGRADNGSYALVYFPNDTLKAKIKINEISGKKANAWWYNPRDGETYDEKGIKTMQPFARFPSDLDQIIVFDPPGDEGPGKDWILVLDDIDSGFKRP